MTFILITITVITCFYFSNDIITEAAKNEPGIIYTPAYTDVSASKLISHEIDSPASGDNSFVGETFTVTINIVNFGSQDIYDINISSPESDIEALGYDSDSLDFPGGSPSGNISTIVATDDDSLIYTVTPNQAGTYLFPETNVTYSNGTDYFFILTNTLEFKVYEEPPSVKVEKTVLFDTFDSDDVRVKIEREFFIKISVTNYYYKEVNASIYDQAPGDVADFNFNATLLNESLGIIDSDASKTYQYNLSALSNGTFIIPKCNATYLISGELLENQTQSNTVTLFVYKPIYEGNDWTKKVPMLSVNKYFQYDDEDGNPIKEAKLDYDNQTDITVMIVINITNSGIVEAYDIIVKEPVYSEWVFDTVGVPDSWGPFNLTEGESQLLNYTITTKIIGIFKIESTEITYSYQNQETLLEESNNKLFSNILEIAIDMYTPPVNLRTEWGITIGISIGIVALAGIPMVVTIIMYRNRRRIQKGT
jgi:hypothetical protein